MSTELPTIDDQPEQYADELREACNLIDSVATDAGGGVDRTLRDAEHVVGTVAAMLEKEGGDITDEDLAERLYPTGGSR